MAAVTFLHAVLLCNAKEHLGQADLGAAMVVDADGVVHLALAFWALIVFMVILLTKYGPGAPSLQAHGGGRASRRHHLLVRWRARAHGERIPHRRGQVEVCGCERVLRNTQRDGEPVAPGTRGRVVLARTLMELTTPSVLAGREAVRLQAPAQAGFERGLVPAWEQVTRGLVGARHGGVAPHAHFPRMMLLLCVARPLTAWRQRLQDPFVLPTAARADLPTHGEAADGDDTAGYNRGQAHPHQELAVEHGG
mmetsp:Transcript_12815/g.38677  ORF Transcript_12815/g.38677 Transcript_12815/m.38677 type:complete len:251 (+) Transcript_12815:123-875(+)